MKNFIHANSQRLAFLTIVVIFLAIPLTVFVAQQQQSIKQEASSEPLLSDDGSLIPPKNLSIAGYVYIDSNKNGERDIEEKGLKNAEIIVLQTKGKERETRTGQIPPPPKKQLATDSQGFFKYTVDAIATDYTVSIVVPSGYKLTTKNTISLNGLGKTARRVVHFGITSTSSCTAIPDECINSKVLQSNACLNPAGVTFCAGALTGPSKGMITGNVTIEKKDLGAVTISLWEVDEKKPDAPLIRPLNSKIILNPQLGNKHIYGFTNLDQNKTYGISTGANCPGCSSSSSKIIKCTGITLTDYTCLSKPSTLVDFAIIDP